jgi:SAM-dependent methyltransferase
VASKRGVTASQGTQPTTPIGSEYSLGNADAERSRLLFQCEIHRGEAEALFDRIGVGPGWSALDVGCGPLGVLDLLSDRVGPTGQVVGLDREPRFLAMAAPSVRERCLGNVELLRAGADATGLPSGSFDLVHERLLLNNVPRPVDVVAEMARLTCSGGWVAVQDMDWISWTCVPAHPDWNRLADAAAAAWSGDVRIGRRLPGLLRAAGLVEVEVDAHIRVFRPDHPYHRLLLRFAAIHRSRILDTGAVLAADLDEATRRLRDHLAEPDGFTLYATLFQAWGRKP